MSATSLVFSSRFSLLSTVSSTTNSYVLNVVRHVEIMKNSHVNHHHHSTSHPCKRKFQLKWYILMSVNSLVFSSLLFLLFTVPPTTKTIWAKIRQVGYPWKWLSMNIIVIQSRCLWVRKGWKEPNLQNPALAPFCHFGASGKAVVARSLTFEQRQVEGWSWWQSWPILCALQLCCWDEDLKSNSFGSRPSITKM